MMDENDPLIRRKLLEAEKAAGPDYPDVKRGAGCGLAGLFAGALGAWSVMGVLNIPRPTLFSLIVGTALIAALIAGGIAAFRPPSR